MCNCLNCSHSVMIDTDDNVIICDLTGEVLVANDCTVADLNQCNQCSEYEPTSECNGHCMLCFGRNF
jgi:hypothetical protein